MRFDQGVTRFIRSAEEVARVVERGTKGTVKSNI
jgi:hypothetical protein